MIETAILLTLYFFPTIIAMARSARAAGGVFVINLFLGWTILGWILALAWAAGGETAERARR